MLYNTTNFLGGAAMKPGSNNISIVTVNASGTNETVRVAYMPSTNPQKFTYDLNGNTTSDGQRTFTWDEENRLVAIESVASAVSADSRKRSEFLYDAQWRRIQRTDYSAWNGSAYATTNSTRYVWDGWLLLTELNNPATGNPTTNFYVHGLDLSGSLQGAGGIGGLLAASSGGTISTSSVFYVYDGNGNVVNVLNTNGSTIATYEYDPFGRTVAQSGTYAATNLWRFSCKQFDDTWGLYYYGYRYYHPDTGRWLSRDPSQVQESIDLYPFTRNDPLGLVDVLGLMIQFDYVHGPYVQIVPRSSDVAAIATQYYKKFNPQGTRRFPPAMMGITITHYTFYKRPTIFSPTTPCACKFTLDHLLLDTLLTVIADVPAKDNIDRHHEGYHRELAKKIGSGFAWRQNPSRTCTYPAVQTQAICDERMAVLEVSLYERLLELEDEIQSAFEPWPAPPDPYEPQKNKKRYEKTVERLQKKQIRSWDCSDTERQ